MITITKNNIFWSELGLENTKIEFVKEVSEKKLMNYLNDSVELSDDVTFGRLFQLLLKNKKIVNKVFHTSLNYYKLKVWEKDFYKNTINDDNYKIVIRWFSELTFDGTELEQYPTISTFDDTVEDVNDKYCGVMFSSLSDLRNKILFLDDRYKIIHYDEKDDYKQNVILQCKKTFTLYDIIQGIFKDICFNGPPEIRDERLQELKDITDRIDSGEEKMFTTEEVREKLKQKFGDDFDENKKEEL